MQKIVKSDQNNDKDKHHLAFYVAAENVSASGEFPLFPLLPVLFIELKRNFLGGYMAFLV